MTDVATTFGEEKAGLKTTLLKAWQLQSQHRHNFSRSAPARQQNGGGTIEDNNADYCISISGINVVVLSFLYSYGNGNTNPSETIGQSCFISTSGECRNRASVASSISMCQANGIKVVFLSVEHLAHTLTLNAEAQSIANYRWESYENSGSTSVQRPFGTAFVNGFDFDVGVASGQTYYPAMITQLRTFFAEDPANQYYITGAPQCPLPEPNIGVIVQSAQFDYLFVQLYNNNAYAPGPCSLRLKGNAPNNYNAWVSFITNTPSSGAQIFLGVPAAPLAANEAHRVEFYYVTPNELASLVAIYRNSHAFGGVMVAFPTPTLSTTAYAQQAHTILLTGTPCGASGLTTTTVLPIATHTVTPTGTATAPVGTGTPLPQWVRCGGEGYTGSTACA
ncbi:putative chitinase [Calycina marina]|uniref:Chitinase n=1 Tax=Calycina marina TaxID=1763456 RepID=A0A9P7Z2W6_9HELO|nr:putative chitinase [Calycina marina]